MSASDLPGPGDRATWGHHAADPRSPDFEGDAPDAFDGTPPLYVGGGILPGSLVISGAADLFDRAGVLLDASGAPVGTVDYINGIVAPVEPYSYPGTNGITYRLGADPGPASCSRAIPVTAANRSSPDFEDDDAPDATAENLEALREWHESFQSAARLRDWRRMEQAMHFMDSLMKSLIEDAR